MMRPSFHLGFRHLCSLGTALVLVACGPGDDDTGKGSSSSGSETGSTSETPTTGTTGEPVPTAECSAPSDCVLINNCCECSAKPGDAEVAACEGNCLQSTCDAELRSGIGVTCLSGRCVFAEVVCDGAVTCSDPLPACPEGTKPAVEDECWGPCVEPRHCLAGGCPIDGCGEGWTCVASQASGLRCVPVPIECGDLATCECVAPYLEEFCPASCSDDGMGKLTCEDGG